MTRFACLLGRMRALCINQSFRVTNALWITAIMGSLNSVDNDPSNLYLPAGSQSKVVQCVCEESPHRVFVKKMVQELYRQRIIDDSQTRTYPIQKHLQ